MPNPLKHSKTLRSALLVVSLCACTDLIGPENPAYEQECVFYAGEGEAFEIPIEVLKRCASVEVRVVRFGATVLYSYVVAGDG